MTLRHPIRSLAAFVVAMCFAWLVVSQLMIWFDTYGGVIGLFGLGLLAAAVWQDTSVGPSWAIGSAVGALPTFLVLGFLI